MERGACSRAEVRNAGYPRSTGDIVVFLDDTVLVQPGWLPPLLRALDTPGVVVAQPLLVRPDHTVHSAGMVFPRRGTLPVDFLADHPVDDARRLGAHLEVSAVTAVALAIRAVPASIELAHETKDAASARGLGNNPRALLSPFVIRMVARAQLTGDALAARGIGD